MRPIVVSVCYVCDYSSSHGGTSPAVAPHHLAIFVGRSNAVVGMRHAIEEMQIASPTDCVLGIFAVPRNERGVHAFAIY